MCAQDRPTVVVGIDGSQDGLLALDWAVELAARRRWAVRAIHVLDQTRPAQPLPAAAGTDDGTEVLEDAADELERLGFTDATLDLRTGHPAEVLLTAAADAALLVIGRRGAGGFAELRVGSVSQICAACARTALVVVPDTWQREESEFGLIAVGVDGSPSGQAALGFAFEAAAERGAELLLIHVPDVPESFPRPGLWTDPEDAPWHRDARRLVGAALNRWPDKYPDVVFRTHYSAGHPIQVLARQSAYADLVVVGGLGLSEYTPLRLGSVARGLLDHTVCPIAIVHSEVSV
jgi:nucleotide-binding universal stress UspA family protein